MATLNHTNPLSVANLGDCLALAQHTFGRVPDDSLILIGLADGLTQGHLRVDLAPVTRSPETAAEQMRQWMLTDQARQPEAMLMVICDQAQSYSEETLDRLSLAVSTAFDDAEVHIAAEHRLQDDSWVKALAETLDEHPELAVTKQSLPEDEAAAWVNRKSDEILYADKESVTELLLPIGTLLLEAEQPDWGAITELEAQLDEAFPHCSNEVKPLVIASKALVAHAKGLGSLAGELVDHIGEEYADNPVVDFTQLRLAGVHPFAASYSTSYARYTAESNGQ